jgi:hypothetical protein
VRNGLRRGFDNNFFTGDKTRYAQLMQSSPGAPNSTAGINLAEHWSRKIGEFQGVDQHGTDKDLLKSG